MLIAIVAGVVLAALALAMRNAWNHDEPTTRPAPRDDAPAAPREAWSSALDDDDEDDDEQLVEAAAITSDGWAFVPRGTGLEVVPPGEDDDVLRDQAERHGSEELRRAMAGAPVNPHTGKRLVFWRPGQSLGPGDMIAARVVRGAPNVDPWRLEALGRDYDYQSFAFETEEAARTAHALVVERIVRAPRDEHGDEIPVGAEDFAVARRQYEETEQALAMEPDENQD